MVWIEIWQKSYNKKYDYEQQDLINRYNDKFDRLIGFLKNNHSMIVEIRRIGERVFVELDVYYRDGGLWTEPIGSVIRADLTPKQLSKFESIFGDDCEWL